MLKINSIAIILLATLGGTAHAAFQSPDSNTNGWGGWTRGDAGTLYAEWDVFNSLPSDITPDVGIANTTTSSIADTTGNAFLTSGGNFYNASGPSNYDALIEGLIPSGPVQVAVQLRTLGTEYGGFTLNGLNADSAIVTDRVALGGFGGEQVDTLLIWNLASTAASYAFNFNSFGAHMSVDAISFDIGAASPVPLPAAAWLLLSGLAGMGVIGRKNKNLQVA